MKHWISKPLREFCIEIEDRCGERDLPVFSVSKNLGILPQAERFKKRIASANISRYKVANPGDFVFDPMLLWSGSISRNTTQTVGVVSPAYCVFRLIKVLNPGLLHLYLTQPERLPFYDSISFGTNERRRKAQFSDFTRLEMPVPPPEEQERIMKLLDEADELRKLRAQADRCTVALVPALFHEMFGDPLTNSHGWPTNELRYVGRVVTGSTPASANQGMFGGEIPFITPGDLEKNTRETMRYVTEAGAEAGRTVRAGSTLVCCIGATIGKTDKTWRRSAFNQQINAVEWGEQVDDDFGFVCMKRSSKAVIRQGSQTALPILKKSLFQQIRIPIPPMLLQKEFATRVREIRELEAQQVASRERLAALFQSMLQRAFRGEL